MEQSVPVIERRRERSLRRRPMRRLELGEQLFEGASNDAIVSRDRLYRNLLMLADAFAVLAAVLVGLALLGDDRLTYGALAIAPLALLTSKVVGLYERDEVVLNKSTLEEAPLLFQSATLLVVLIEVGQGFVLEGVTGPLQILVLWGLLFACGLVFRTVARHLAARIATPERCLVVGDLRSTGAVGAKLERETARQQLLAGRLPLDFAGDSDDNLAAIERAVHEHQAHRVILAPQTADSEMVLDAIRLVKSLGVKVSLLPRLFEVVGSSVVFDQLDGVTVLGVRRFGLSPTARWIKRGMDVLGAGLGVLAIAPVMAVIAVAVRLDSPGQIFFRQVRVGRDGKRFEMLKFRTMVANAEDLKEELRDGAVVTDLFKLTHDPRITRVGRILRATSLDELPQFLNVVRGDMSLVGPRPLVVDEDALVEGWHRRRLYLTPGMTGPWQVLGATRVPLQEMVKIDYLYIANWSLWRDVAIILRTIGHMTRRSGL
jgi:exopolysaccharide biosynthesis polyprenyl glycosylphosphotransferase